MNYLTVFRQYMDNTETPPDYTDWAAISSIACALGKKVWVNYADRWLIYPNLYIILVGLPASGKTTAQDITRRLVRNLDLPLVAEVQTKEAICKEMESQLRTDLYGSTQVQQSPMCMFPTELSNFLGTAQSGTSMIDFLTTVYDRDIYDYKTKNMGQNTIIEPCVNILSCTTPSWIRTLNKGAVISGGFARRCIFVNAEATGKRIAFPRLTEEQKECLNYCQKHLTNLIESQSYYGEMEFSSGFEDQFTLWYETREISDDPNIQHWDKARHILGFKVATCLAAGQTPPSKTITWELYWEAIGLIKQTESKLIELLSTTGSNRLAAVAAQAIDMIRAKKRIRAKELKMLLFAEATALEQKEIMDYLRQGDSIVTENDEYGKTWYVWRGKVGVGG